MLSTFLSFVTKESADRGQLYVRRTEQSSLANSAVSERSARVVFSGNFLVNGPVREASHPHAVYSHYACSHYCSADKGNAMCSLLYPNVEDMWLDAGACMHTRMVDYYRSQVARVPSHCFHKQIAKALIWCDNVRKVHGIRAGEAKGR